MKTYDKQQILSRADIVAEIGSRVELRRRGAQWVGCCPFHDDRRPSMAVTPASSACNGFFKCFVCDAKGDVITFLRRYEGWDYPTTLRYLAEQTHVDSLYPATRRRAEKRREKNPEAELEEFEEDPAAYRASLDRLFGASPLVKHLKGLLFGTSSYWNIADAAAAYGWGVDEHGADMFRYYAADGKLTKIKHQRYTADGHRHKAHLPWIEPKPADRARAGKSLRKCFFGEHLAAASDASVPVVVVESEKTALICAIIDKMINYIATGGESQIRALSELPWLSGRKVILAADLDDITDPQKGLWGKVAREHDWLTAQQVFPGYVKVLEGIGAKSDLADYYLSIFEGFQETEEAAFLRALVKNAEGEINRPLWNMIRALRMSIVPDGTDIHPN